MRDEARFSSRQSSRNLKNKPFPVQEFLKPGNGHFQTDSRSTFVVFTNL